MWGLGFATAPEDAWLAGGSPTAGFLQYATKGPFASLFQSLAGQVWVDGLFMAGLALIGTALILGMGVRIAGVRRGDDVAHVARGLASGTQTVHG